MRAYRFGAISGAVVAILIGATSGCQAKGKVAKAEGGPPEGVTLSAPGASPGMTVVISVPEAHFDTATPPAVRIASQVVPVRVLGPNQLEALVPQTSPGATQIEIPASDHSPAAKAAFTVFDSVGTELVFSLKDGQVELVAQYPTDSVSNNAPRPNGAQFRVEVLNKLGGPAFQTVVDDPRYAEVFEPAAAGGTQIRNEMTHGPALFRVKVPKVPDGTVKLFALPPAGAAAPMAVNDVRLKPIAEFKLPSK